jgi:hypothetical protein
MRGIRVNWLAVGILAILIVYGLWAGYTYSLNLELGSDTVVPGLVSMEIFEHSNFQFDFPVNDPYLFTDIYTFHLLPQLFSGYDPTVLRLTAFAMFLILIAIFSYLVYRYAGLVSAMMFAALMANLDPGAYTYFINPEWHVGTLIATGVFIILMDPGRVKKRSVYLTAACVLAMALVLLSDSIFLALFIIPYIAYYVLFDRQTLKKYLPQKKVGKRASEAMDPDAMKELRKMDVLVSSVAVVPAIAWLFKTFEPKSIGASLPYFNSTPVNLGSLSQMLAINLPLYFQCLALLVSHGLYNVLSLQISIPDIPLAIMFIAALGISAIRTNKRARYLYAMFLASAIVLFLGFTLTSLADGLWSSRFLIFTAVSIFSVISLSYDEKDEKNGLNTILLVLVVALILSSVPLQYSTITSLDGHPNQAQYDLIDYMQGQGYTYGYAEYDDANLLTYLSKEQLTIRAVRPVGNAIQPYPWLASAKWYTVRPGEFFVLSKNNTRFDGEMFRVITKSPPTYTGSYKDYIIYDYDYTHK